MAKSRVVLGIDGLETRIWGSRDNLRPYHRINNERSDLEHDEDDRRSFNEERKEGAEDPDASDEEDDQDVESFENFLSLAESLPPDNSRDVEQKFLQNAERLLSRTLAMTDVTGNGLGAELSTLLSSPI